MPGLVRRNEVKACNLLINHTFRRHYPNRGAMSGNLLIKVLHLYKSKLVNDSGDYPDFAG